METKKIKINPKQKQALQILTKPDNNITELLYGGGAGGGKSYLGCIWLTQSAITYPGSRWFLSREVNKDIRESSLLTLLEVMKTKFGLTSGVDFKYKIIDSRIEFANDSMIVLKELPYIPSDPECDYLGSMEYTGGFIDEAQEIQKKVRDTMKTRIRYKLEEFNLIPKLLETCNPGKNYLYDEFWKPHSKGEPLKEGRFFLPALVTDNPRISKEYVKALQELDDESMKQRLLYGNWDYEIVSNQLVLTQWLENQIVNNYNPAEKKKGAVDVAREGGDSTVASVWVGNTLVWLEKINVPIMGNVDISGAIAQKLIQFYSQWGVGYEDIEIDAVGVGGGVVDAMRRQGWYVNSYKGGEGVESKEEFTDYKNLRTYSYWQFRVGVQKGEIFIHKDCPFREELFRDFTAHEYEINDKMIILLEKEQVKRKIGRSPDYSDAVVMAYAPSCKNKFGFIL